MPTPHHAAEPFRTVRSDRAPGLGEERQADIELRAGPAATLIDGRLLRASRGRDITNRVLTFYLDELQESGKYRDLGYTCLAQYADQRLGIDPRRARELCQAGRALLALTQVDRACREGTLSWTKAELLTHGIAEHQQAEWIERATRAGCGEVRRMLHRHRKGLPPEPGKNGGLPHSEFEFHETLSATLHDRIEREREELMRKRGVFVDDSEVLRHILQAHPEPKRDATRDAERAAACEQDATPDWMRNEVLARDHHRCQACGSAENLHAHHIVFRSRGGPTRPANLTTTCVRCHGLIHEGRLLVSGEAPDGVEFTNRFGEPLVTQGAAERSVPRPVLRLLVAEGAADGGQPPREAEIPDVITPEWFKANMHPFDVGRDGVWRLRKSKRR